MMEGIQTSLLNSLWGKTKGVALVLALGGLVSCAALKQGLDEILNQDEILFPKYKQTSPFYQVPPDAEGDIDFFVDFQGTWKEGVYDVELFYSLNTNDQQFVKTEGEKYRSEFTVGLQCYDKDGEYVFDKIWDETLTFDNFESTKADNAIIRRKSFQIAPGEYMLVVNFEDHNSKQKAKVERENVIVESFKEDDLVLSDIGFPEYKKDLFGDEQDTSSIARIKLLQYSNRRFKDVLDISYMIYNNKNPVNIEYSIFDAKGNQLLPDSLRTESVEDIKTARFDLGEFANGVYLLGIEAKSDNLSTGISKQFGIYKAEFDLADDFDFTLKLVKNFIQYDSELYEQLKKSKPGESRENTWYEFWKEFDPTSDTRENEFLDEFAKRVHFANENFSAGGLKGSDSHMGIVWICCGPPDEIIYETMPRESRPYKIWQYYHSFKFTPYYKFYFYDPIGVGADAYYRLWEAQQIPPWFEYD